MTTHHREADKALNDQSAVVSFQRSSFHDIVAHSGNGLIRTARVIERGRGTICNFIDIAVVPSRSSIGVHRHGASDEEIYVVISGVGEMFVDGALFCVGPGDVIVNRPGGEHGLRNVDQTDLVIVVIDVPVSKKDEHEHEHKHVSR